MYIFVTSILIFSMVATNISIVFADENILNESTEQTDEASNEIDEMDDNINDTSANEEDLSEEKPENTDKEASTDDKNETVDEPTDTNPSESDEEEKVTGDNEEFLNDEKEIEFQEDKDEGAKGDDLEQADKEPDKPTNENEDSSNEEQITDEQENKEESTNKDEEDSDKEVSKENESEQEQKEDETVDEEVSSLQELENIFNDLRTMDKGDFNDGSWNTFMDILGEVDNLFTDEAELAAASEEYINDLIYELEAAFANLEIDQVDTSIVEAAYDAFKQKYADIDITNLMDFYDDGYGNLEMLEYIEQYITSGQTVATTQENEEILTFLNTLDQSLEKEINKLEAEEDKQKETSKKENEETKKPSKEKVKQEPNPERLIKDETVQKSVAKVIKKQEKKNKVKRVQQAETKTKTKTFREVVVTPIEEVWIDTTETVDDFRNVYILPNTATPYFKYIVAGTLMIVEGIFLFAYFRFFSFVRNRFGFF